MLKTNRRNFMMGTAAIAVASTAGAKFTFAQERRALRLGVNGLPNSLEPVNAISNVGPRIVNQIFDTLIARDFSRRELPAMPSTSFRHLPRAGSASMRNRFASSCGRRSCSTMVLN